MTSYRKAVLAAAAHRADTGLLVKAALAADPDCVLAHCLCGFFAWLLVRRESVAAARNSLEHARAAVERRGADTQERRHVAALEHALAGRTVETAEQLGDAVAADPNDLAAIKLEHAVRFMLGDNAGMRASLERAISAWTPDRPGYGYVLGCLAFALEETGALDAALVQGQAACDAAPDDAWAIHAVAHVHEMTGRAEQGLAWLRSRVPALAGVNNFRHHLDWHEALFLLELGRGGEALALYDQRLTTIRRDDFRDLANAASLLARLEVAGVDVGERWSALGELARERIDECGLAFASLHDLLALLGARREEESAALLRRMRRAAAEEGAQSRVLARTGLLLAEMLCERCRGADAGAAQLFLAAEPALALLGGSHAQRDLFRRLAIHSARRADQPVLAYNLLERRRRFYRRSNRAAACEAVLVPSHA